MVATLRGITWDHPRGYAGLFAATAQYLQRNPQVRIEWDRQPLSGFEATPIESLAARYDLLILDHPFMGDAQASGCLLDLDSYGDVLELDALRSDVIGPSFDIYRYGGLWAVPLDASTQMSVYRPDRVEAPRTLDDIRALARTTRLAIALHGPHALLTWFSIYSNLGAPPAGDAQGLIEEKRGLEALELLRTLYAWAVPECVDWNSIAMLEAMSVRDDLGYCPYVYGFATYGKPAAGRHALRYCDVPALMHGAECKGAMLGGTGLAISARCAAREAALAYAAFLTAPAAQKQMAMAGGHPVRRSVWCDRDLDASFGGFYAATQATMLASAVRPRYPGYIRLQIEGGGLTEGFLRERSNARELVAGINALHQRLRFG